MAGSVHQEKRIRVLCIRKIPFWRGVITAKNGQPGLRVLSLGIAEHFLGAEEQGPFGD